MSAANPTARSKAVVATAITGTAFIAVLAFWLSFTALTHLAIRADIAEKQAWAWPLIVDGVIVVATVAVVALRGRAGSKYAWALLASGAAVSVTANAIQAAWPAGKPLPAGLAAAICSVPPIVLLAITHLTVVLGRGHREDPSENIAASSEAALASIFGADATIATPSATPVMPPDVADVPWRNYAAIQTHGQREATVRTQVGAEPARVDVPFAGTAPGPRHFGVGTPAPSDRSLVPPARPTRQSIQAMPKRPRPVGGKHEADVMAEVTAQETPSPEPASEHTQAAPDQSLASASLEPPSDPDGEREPIVEAATARAVADPTGEKPDVDAEREARIEKAKQLHAEGVSKKQIAKRLGVTDTTVARWLKEKSD